MSGFRLSFGPAFWTVTGLLLASTAHQTPAHATIDPETGKPLEFEEIIVTTTPVGRSVFETTQGVDVLTGEDLALSLSGTIGETLRRQPGISSTFFGPGASRPIIRGQGGDRIRILDSDIGSIDASVTSDDHAVAIDPVLAQRIEIVRGTGALLYGSNAAGGVINIFDGRIPEVVPEGGYEIGARYTYSTVDEGHEVAGAFNYAFETGSDMTIVLHGEGFYREADDYDIPGFAESAALRAAEEAEEEEHEHEEEEGHEEEEEAFGTVENSNLETKGGAGGVSFIFSNGFIGFSGKVLKSDYGVPGHGHEEGHEEEEEEHEEEEGHEEEEEEIVRIDLDQVRYDLRGELETDLLFFQKAKLRIGYADYEHAELEGDEIGTVFTNEGWEGRLELVQKDYGILKGAVGFQFRSREFSAVGEEAFVPPTDTTQFGIFAVEEIDLGDWLVDIGGRYERTNQEATVEGIERDFDAISVSGGFGYRGVEDVFFGVTGFRTERAPATEELFSNGPHLATDSFEIGDPDLDKEVATGVEGVARINRPWFSAQVSAYYTTYDDFIALLATGEEEDGLPVFQFTPVEAEFRGFEAEAEVRSDPYEIFDTVIVQFYADASIDLVRATFDNPTGSDDLPRIPPLSGIIGGGFRSDYVDFRAELEYAGEQDDVAEFELPTEDYQLVNLFLTIHPFGQERNVAIDIRALNLTDEEARLHTSFLKDLVPLPGRNVKVSLRTVF